MTAAVDLAIEHWEHVAPVLRRPESEEEYLYLVKAVKALEAMNEADELPSLTGLIEIIGDHLEAYERDQVT